MTAHPAEDFALSRAEWRDIPLKNYIVTGAAGFPPGPRGGACGRECGLQQSHNILVALYF